MKTPCLYLTFYIAITSLAFAQEVRNSGHYDLSITYEPDNGGWSTGIFDYQNNTFLGPDAFIFEMGDAYRGSIPAGEPWSLIGTPGEPVWVLPEVFEAERIYLGFGTQNMQRGIFTGGLSNRGRINIRLVSVTGSGVDVGGTLTMWQAGFPPLVHYATGNGIGPEDALNDVPAGAHSHYNWAFTQPGDYSVTFEVSGELTPTYGGGQTSTQVTYLFRVDGEVGLPGILTGVDAGGGWKYSESLGFFDPASYPWVYLEDQGWWYFTGAEGDSAFIWDSQLGWLWTSTDVFPSLYSFERDAWLLFAPTDDSVRWFFQSGAEWFSVPLS